ncbi:5507_t:CDS:2, partial [Entrophospora sp. SA101]
LLDSDGGVNTQRIVSYTLPQVGLYSTTNSADEFEYGIDFSKTLVQSINGEFELHKTISSPPSSDGELQQRQHEEKPKDEAEENDRENDIQPIPLRYINDKELLSPIVDIDPRSTVKIAIIKPSLSKIKDYDIDEKTNHLKDTLESTLQLEYVIPSTPINQINQFSQFKQPMVSLHNHTTIPSSSLILPTPGTTPTLPTPIASPILPPSSSYIDDNYFNEFINIDNNTTITSNNNNEENLPCVCDSPSTVHSSSEN